MPEKDAGELADQREREADRMARKSAELQGDVDEVRHDWQQKRAYERVPGAPPEDSEDDGSEGDSEEDDSDADDTESEASARSEADAEEE